MAVDRATAMRYGQKGNYRRLRRLLNSDSPEVREIASEAMGLINTADSANVLIIMLRDPTTQVQIAAAKSLGKLTSGGIKAHLNKLMQTSPDEQVREACRLAIDEYSSNEKD